MTMWRLRRSVSNVFTAAVGVAGFVATHPALGQNPCEQIVAACARAGFVRGGAASGNGIGPDCVAPIMQGIAPRRGRDGSLPPVDPQLVAACAASSPEFGRSGVQSNRRAALPEPMPVPAPPTSANRQRHPNIVFILTDDLAWNLVPFMPHVQEMQKQGVTFANYFVTDSLCCPSRSSIFTGRFPHDTGVFRNTGSDGGYSAFVNRGNNKATFATVLSAAGYRTAMMGKYLNGYIPAQHRPDPGWTTWSVAGHGYAEFKYALNQDGRVVHYGDKPADYLTDVLAAHGARFIQQSAGAPFLLEVATFAPHAPYTPAPRDANALPDLRAPRSPAFDAEPDANAAKWLTVHTPLTRTDVANIDRDFRKRAQSVLAVDALIGRLQAAVAAIGAQDNTYFVFSSDNGYHMGEHRLMPGKMTAYDTDIRVPLIVTGPGVHAGISIDEVVENIDLGPTFADLAGADALPNSDGRSVVSLLHGQKVADWRRVALVEHRGPHKDPTDPDAPAMRSGNPITYEAIRAKDWVYVEYEDGEREYHDHVTDPNELRNTFELLPEGEKAALHATLEAIKNCHDAGSCAMADGRGSVKGLR
jgi:N-acetylglucosamine-6-sulfatase